MKLPHYHTITTRLPHRKSKHYLIYFIYCGNYGSFFSIRVYSKSIYEVCSKNSTTATTLVFHLRKKRFSAVVMRITTDFKLPQYIFLSIYNVFLFKMRGVYDIYKYVNTKIINNNAMLLLLPQVS